MYDTATDQWRILDVSDAYGGFVEDANRTVWISNAESASPGLLAAVGVEFMRLRTAQINVELALDQSEVEFDKITCSNTGTNCRTARESLNTADVMFGVAVKF